MIINRASALVKELFSEEVERFIRVKKFKDGTLWFAVTNSAIAQTVLMKSIVMKKRLNESFEDEFVEKIRTFQEVEEKEEVH